MIGMHDRFGASAPAKDLMSHYGFTVHAVVARARTLVRVRASRVEGSE